MAWTDFRHFLRGLEEAGELRRIPREVSPEFEIAAYIRRASDTNGPAFLFEHVHGHPGWTVAGGVYSTYSKLALALGTDLRSISDVYGRAVRSPIPPITVSDGPVKEVVVTGARSTVRSSRSSGTRSTMPPGPSRPASPWPRMLRRACSG